MNQGAPVVAAFGTAVILGTLLLSLPVATEHGDGAGLVTALFTATSAVCVTGTSWSTRRASGRSSGSW